MADDNNSRYRPNDGYGRAPGPAGPASDPLAELAKLIGQSDPFAEFGQPAAPSQQDHAPYHAPRGAEPSYGSDYRAEPHFGGDYAQSSGRAAPTQDWPAPDRAWPAADRSWQNATQQEWPGSSDQDWPGSPQPPQPSYRAPDPYAAPPQQQSAPVPGFDTPYPDPSAAAPPPFLRPVPGYDPPPMTQAPQGYAPQSYAPPPLYPSEPDAGGMPPPHDDEFYDDAPRGGRRKGMLTVAAVLGLAVVGTASAVGYRSFFGGSSASAPPPVIRASSEPSKVAPPPATASADPSAGKFNYDRFADRGKDEQVVKREETPLEPKELTRSAQPRTVFPGAPVVGTPQSRSTVSANTGSANPPSAIGEPRRVRTVPIRPEQGDAAPSPPATGSNALPPPPASRQASAVSPPLDTSPARSTASSRSASRIVASPPPPSANAPLSLSPDGAPPQAAERDFPPSQPPARTAAVAPRAPSPAPRASGGGRYHVQVSSQKSESDAESSFRSIQSRFSGVLGGQPHVIRRADLGSRGVYYRAMVGPFASREEAVQLCSSLKSAGGDCVVQSN